MTIRWGIAGPGRIAHGVARDLALVEGCRLVAVGSRSPERAAAFAAEFGAEQAERSGSAPVADRGAPRPAGEPVTPIRAHGSYAELLADGGVDVVYIATPHRQHAAIARAALEAGRAVLVEKAFTCTVAGAGGVVDVARRHGVFAMEAMWTRFAPLVVRMRELIGDGAIGEVRSVHADLGIVSEVDPTHRLWDPAQGGGALLDLGVYVVSFAHLLLGPPSSVQVRGSIGPTGVEQDVAMLLGYQDGSRALLDCSMRAPFPGGAMVVGTAGRISVAPRFHHPTAMVLHRLGAGPERIEAPLTGTGYYHELVEVRDCLLAGRTESAVMPLDHTLQVMAVLEQAMHSLGLEQSDDATLPV